MLSFFVLLEKPLMMTTDVVVPLLVTVDVVDVVDVVVDAADEGDAVDARDPVDPVGAVVIGV
jgi:hypothetical protein